MTYFWINETIGLEAIIRKNTYVYKWSKSICYLGYQLKQLHIGWKNTPLYSIQWRNMKLTYSIILMYSILMVFLRKMTKISWTIPVSNQYIWPLFSLSSLFTKLFIRIHNQPIQISFKFHRIHPQHICELHQVIFSSIRCFYKVQFMTPYLLETIDLENTSHRSIIDWFVELSWRHSVQISSTSAKCHIIQMSLLELFNNYWNSLVSFSIFYNQYDYSNHQQTSSIVSYSWNNYGGIGTFEKVDLFSERI